MKIYVLRHGNTDANINHVITGVTDVDINEKGVEQAKEAGEKLRKLDYDIVFCSPLIRAKSTCKYANTKNKQVLFDERLIERNAGKYEGTIHSKSNNEGLDLTKYWNYNLDIKYPQAEGIRELFKRVNSFIEMLKSKYIDKNILIVTHCGVCRAIECYFLGIPKDGNTRIYSHDNCQIKEYEIRE